MAFTFNWAGFSTPDIKGGDKEYIKTIREGGSALGSALLGYKIDKANKEYADILDSKNKIGTISARISQLEQRNAELRMKLQQMGQVAVAPNPEYAMPTRVGNVIAPMNYEGYPVSNAFGGIDQV